LFHTISSQISKYFSVSDSPCWKFSAGIFKSNSHGREHTQTDHQGFCGSHDATGTEASLSPTGALLNHMGSLTKGLRHSQIPTFTPKND
jgi:hypothetical protein